jgi:hypothetical protein
MSECAGEPRVLCAASVQQVVKFANFRRIVDRCSALGIRVTRTGFSWLIEGGPAGVYFGALDLSTVKPSDLTRARHKNGREHQKRR